MRRPRRRAFWVAVVALLVAGSGASAAPATPEPPGGLSQATEQRYAAAIEALRQGDASPVLREFGTPEAARSLVADYVQYVYAEALLRSDDLAGARQVAEAVAERFPDRRIGRSALLLAAYTAARAGDEAGNEALLRRFLSGYAESPETAIALYLLGLSLEARGQRENAAQTYRQLTLLAPTSEYADGAADRLRELARAGVALPPVSVEDRLARAERLLRGGMAGAAHDEANAVAADATAQDAVLRALGVAASALSRLKRYDAAARIVEQALTRAPEDGKPTLQLERGRLLYRAGRNEQALAALAGLDGAPEPEAAAAAYLRGVLLEEGGRFTDAAAAYERTAARYTGRDVAASALWRLGWLAYLQGDRAGAADRWTRLGDLAAGRHYRLAATYWIGRAREEMGASADAARLYERLLAEAPRSYYGILAATRAKAATPRPEPVPPLELPGDPGRALTAADPDRARIETLGRLGLQEYAAAEMEDVALRALDDPVKLYWLSSAYRQQERYDLSLRILRRYFGAVAASGHPALPRAFWELAYPLAWQSELTEAADRSGLDPFFVAAVVREESSFYPLALSRAGARGLMQLLPQTARTIAERRGLPFGNGGLLDEPGPNLRLGSAMLAELMKEFADPRLAIAAYNAGPARVREWWGARRTGDVEAFVEQIPYEETRLYVKRVMVSWEEYRRLYGNGSTR